MSTTAARRPSPLALIALLVLADVGFRIWFVLSPLGLVDGDEAVVGLMARRMLDGQFEAFYWGQEYGGSLEAALVAALLAVGIPGRWAMELVPVGLHAGAAVLVWRIGLRTIDRPGGAALAGALSWGLSPALIWWSTKERGFYGVTLVCGLLLLLFCERLSGHSPGKQTQNAAVLGLAAGVGWWSSPQVLHFLVPAGLWLVWTHRHRPADLARTLAIAAPAAIIGATPWLWANVHTGLASLDPTGDGTTFGGPFEVFFTYGLPMVLGLRRPITLGWELPGTPAVYLLALAGLALAIGRWRRPLRPVLLAVALYPIVFALLPTTYYYGEPRYLDYLWPLLALVAASALARLPLAAQALAVAAALAITANGVLHMTQLEGPPGKAFEDISPRPVDPVVDELDRLGVDRAYADYWLAYRLTWETEGRIVATPIQFVRQRTDDDAVRAASDIAYVVVRGSCLDDQLETALADTAATSETVSEWRIYAPAESRAPDDLGLTAC